MLVVVYLVNTKWCKKVEKWPKTWHMSTHMRVIGKSCPMKTNMTGFKTFWIFLSWTKVVTACKGLPKPQRWYQRIRSEIVLSIFFLDLWKAVTCGKSYIDPLEAVVYVISFKVIWLLLPILLVNPIHYRFLGVHLHILSSLYTTRPSSWHNKGNLFTSQ